MDNKIFSVIIPVYNGERTIGRTLASLISNQSYIHEIIIVDDGCTDNSIQEVEKYQDILNHKIKIVCHSDSQRHGAGSSRQLGIDIAEGKYVTFVDADDCLTPNSLHYVYQKIKGVVLLHTQTIYYESGVFEREDIEYSDWSCGGNFYLTQYLKDHQLTFHPELWMAEDEYFNEKIYIYMKYLDSSKPKEEWYSYPVYEVHHDDEGNPSFALGNWVEYSVKYHLLYMKYIVQDYIRYPKLKNHLQNKLIKNLIFIFFEVNALLQDNPNGINMDEIKEWFTDTIKYFKFAFMSDIRPIIKYYNKSTTKDLLKAAERSQGSKIEILLNFEDFINQLNL